MSDDQTRAVFDATAARYNTDRAKLIPGFAQFYGAALSLIPADAERILDLGAGTGLFSAMVRDRFPEARLHLIDNSEPMLAQASERFADDKAVTVQLGDYTTTDLGSGYDAIVSALSIHHLDDPAKQALCTRVFSALKSGGVFINAEQVLAPTDAAEAQARLEWLSAVRAAGATEPQIADSLLRQQQDLCSPVEEQLAWLRAAGFRDVHCAYAEGRFAVLTGLRP